MKKLLKFQERISELQTVIGLLDWELKLNVPSQAEDDLIKIITKYSDKLFKLQTSKEYGKLLFKVINSSKFKKLDRNEQNYIKNLYRNYQNNINIPKDFYSKYTELINRTEIAWKKAKETNNYDVYKPFLKDVIKMTKKYYGFFDSDYDNLYDVMLDYYEKGMTTKVIEPLFEELKNFLIPFINDVAIKEKTLYSANFSKEQMLKCAEFLLKYIGFDLEKGKVDFFPHGFTEKISPNDVRITFTSSANPVSFVTTIIHEGGHGLFEQNVDESLTKYEYSGIENCFALHESISRFYENMLGRNPNFWSPIYEEIKSILNIDIPLDEFCQMLNEVVKSPIRTDADEVTYPLHIIIRYEIERDLFNGVIDVDDLPEVWKNKTKDYLGLDVQNDTEGLMQDIHWSQGAFGYFPSYLLGSIYDGMILKVIEEELGDIDKILKDKDVLKITQFLKERIFVNGGAFPAEEVLKDLGYLSITVKPLIQYYQKKYYNNK